MGVCSRDNLIAVLDDKYTETVMPVSLLMAYGMHIICTLTNIVHVE